MKVFHYIFLFLFVFLLTGLNAIELKAKTKTVILPNGYSWYMFDKNTNNLLKKSLITAKQIKTKEFGIMSVVYENAKSGGFDIGFNYSKRGKKIDTYIEVSLDDKDRMMKNEPPIQMYSDIRERELSVYIYDAVLYVGVKK